MLRVNKKNRSSCYPFKQNEKQKSPLLKKGEKADVTLLVVDIRKTWQVFKYSMNVQFKPSMLSDSSRIMESDILFFGFQCRQN